MPAAPEASYLANSLVSAFSCCNCHHVVSNHGIGSTESLPQKKWVPHTFPMPVPRLERQPRAIVSSFLPDLYRGTANGYQYGTLWQGQSARASRIRPGCRSRGLGARYALDRMFQVDIPPIHPIRSFSGSKKNGSRFWGFNLARQGSCLS